MSDTNPSERLFGAEASVSESENISGSLGASAHNIEPISRAQELAPRADWSRISEREHVVQFYESDTFLVDSLSGSIATRLGDDEVCIVVATKGHRDGIDHRLESHGIEVTAAKATGQYICLDAADILSQFLVDGSPDPGRFSVVIGGLIAQAKKRRRPVRVFGEMVALLWADGKNDAALELEGFWNELQKAHSFSLFCAYPINGFDGGTFAGGLNDVCTAHARVIPAESYTALDNSDHRLRNIIELQQKARSLEAEISERKQVEEQLRVSFMQENMAREAAERANRLKDEFLATVSHELRTPLNAIIGWSHMIRNRDLDENTMKRAIETIERNAKSQAQLIEDILDVSRVITGKLNLKLEPVDLATVINAAVDSVQLAADAKGIRLEVMVAPSARHVIGDATRVQQIVWNLLANAIKFTPLGGRVDIRLERSGSHAQIKVSDTGEGIESTFLPFIFDRFRQADGASTRSHGGLGLGLAIVRHLVELHGGTAHAESKGKGEGATFIIRLPLAIAERNTRRKKESARRRRNDRSNVKPEIRQLLDGVQVVLVDDDLDSLNMLSAILSEHKAIVQTATSTSEALEILRWFKADILVSDLAMPGEDGCALIEKVRALDAESGRQTAAVALTAYVSVADRTRALSAGFNMFVPKPVEPNELIVAIVELAEANANQVLVQESKVM